MAAIELEDASKRFRSARRAPGLLGAARQLVRGRYDEVDAVANLTFRIEAGERVAFIGPNGAGKSTTIKMLCGILHPDSGSVRVLGLVPWRERRALGYEIGTVFGQRSRLWYHLPASDTYDLLARVYDLDPATYRQRRDELIATFGVAALVAKPVRTLSLGERMRCELVAALLHRPRVLFLDEPTIGLDVVAKATLRETVLATAARDGTTILLTSHDTGDMERVCDRAIVIHRGRLLFDRDVATLRSTFIQRKLVTVLTEDDTLTLSLPGVTVTAAGPHRTELEVETARTPIEAVIREVLGSARVQDITVEDPPMEAIIAAIYGEAEGESAVEEVA